MSPNPSVLREKNSVKCQVRLKVVIFFGIYRFLCWMVYKAESNSSGGLALVLDRYRTVVVGTKMNSMQNKSPHNSAKHEDLSWQFLI